MRNTLLFLSFFNPHRVVKSYQNSAILAVIKLKIHMFFACGSATLISNCFKMLLLGVLKLRNTYIYPLVDVSIRFRPLLDSFLNAYSEVSIHFALFEFCCCFTVRKHDVLLDYMRTPQWGPMEITWFKSWHLI